jgi:hypothetical protein
MRATTSVSPAGLCLGAPFAERDRPVPRSCPAAVPARADDLVVAFALLLGGQAGALAAGAVLVAGRRGNGAEGESAGEDDAAEGDGECAGLVHGVLLRGAVVGCLALCNADVSEL